MNFVFVPSNFKIHNITETLHNERYLFLLLKVHFQNMYGIDVHVITSVLPVLPYFIFANHQIYVDTFNTV